MKKWENYDWEQFNKDVNGKKLILWGAGKRCHEIIRVLSIRYDIPFIVDIDSAKWGEILSGILICSPEKLLEFNEKFCVLITPQFPGSIANYLDKMGIYDYYSEFWLSNDEKYIRQQKNIPDDKVSELNRILYDKESKNILKEIINKRKEGIMDYSDIMDTAEYFRDDFFQRDENEVYIDAGAFNGDSILNFINFNPYFNKIFAFEADRKNYKKLLQSFAYQAFKDKIAVFNKGVYDCNKNIKFHIGLGVSTCSVNEASMRDCFDGKTAETAEIECVSLDDIINEKVTFIKMDVEGCEMKAINGAEKLIKTYNPKLAISIYHKTNDLWDIPLALHKMVPDYKLYIRHHSIFFTDTILYATL